MNKQELKRVHNYKKWWNKEWLNMEKHLTNILYIKIIIKILNNISKKVMKK